MGKVVVTQFITLDGVVEDPGGSEDSERGGWAFEFNRGEEGDKFKYDEVIAAGALLLGRRTYEGFAAAWPSREGEFADLFNGLPKYVVSSTLSDPEWSNSHVLGGDLTTEINRLKQDVDGDILINGSVQLCRALGDAGLIDEWRLMLYPVVLGKGKKLFADDAAKVAMQLASAQPIGDDGVVILVYTPKANA